MKEWKESDLIPVWDTTRDQEIYLKAYSWVKNPNNVGGVYKKSGESFRVGEEQGRKYWAIGNPKNGRFEYRKNIVGTRAIFQLMPKFLVETIFWEKGLDGKSDSMYLYQGLIFMSEEDLLLYIYLRNEHDYSDRDMTYFVGKRQYHDELVVLPNVDYS